MNKKMLFLLFVVVLFIIVIVVINRKIKKYEIETTIIPQAPSSAGERQQAVSTQPERKPEHKAAEASKDIENEPPLPPNQPLAY